MKSKKLFMKFYKDVSFFNTNEGAEVKMDGTVDGSRWSIDVAFANGYIPINDPSKVEERLLDYVKDTFGINNIDGEEEYFFTINDDGAINFCLVEDGDGYHVHYTEQKEKTTQLYLCDYVIILEVHEVTKPSQTDLANMLKGFDVA